MKKHIAILILFIASFTQAQNVGINTTGVVPNASAMLDVDAGTSGTRGLLIPRLVLVASNNASPVTSPATSLLIYNTATAGSGATAVSPGYYYWDGANWLRLQATSSIDWNLLGNSGTSAATNFLGTTDNVDLTIRTNNTEKMRVLSNGNVGIGTAAPGFKFHVASGFIGTDYLNTTDNSVNSGVTGIMIKAGDNFLRTGTAASINTFLGNWNLLGNASTNPATNFLGTTDAQDLVFRTNNTEKMRVLSNGNIGVGTATPAYKLDLFGGTIGYGNSNSRSETRTDAGLIGSSGAQSGFYENGGSVTTNYPAGATSWWHLIDVRHSNTGNNFAMQISGSFFDQDLFYRKTDNNAAQAWSRILSSTNGGQFTTCNTVNFLPKVTGTGTVGCSQVFDNGTNVGIGTAAPGFKLHVPSGYIGTDYVNSTDNSVATGVTGIMIKAGDNFLRTGTAASINTFLGNWSLLGNASTNAATNFLGTTDNVDLVFRTNNTEKMRIQSGGNVGIGGAPSAGYKLDVKQGIIRNTFNGFSVVLSQAFTNTTEFSAFIGTRARGTEASPSYPQLDNCFASFIGRDGIDAFATNFGGAGMYMFATENISATNKGVKIVFQTTPNGTTGTLDRMVINENGNVGIGVAVPGSALHTGGAISSNTGYRCRNGTGGSFSGNNFNLNWAGGGVLDAWVDFTNVGNVLSDRRLKDNIKELQNGSIERVMKLKPVSFKYKDIPGSIFTGSDILYEGFIADELQQVIPSAVKGQKDDLTVKGTIQPQSIELFPIVSVLTKAMQEQQTIIETQKQQLEELNAKSIALEKQLTEILELLKNK